MNRHFAVLTPAVVFIGIWEYFTLRDPTIAFLCGRPHEVLFSMLELLKSPSIWWDLAYTFSATALGLLIGSILGTAVGLTLATFPLLLVVSRGYLVMLGAVPVLAFAPLVVLWIGIGWWTKVALASYAAGLVTLQLAVTGARDAYKRYREILELSDAKGVQPIRLVILPGALLWLTEGYRAGVGAAVLGTFIGECLNSDAGIGHMMMRASGLYRVNEVWCGVVLLGLSALLLGAIIERLIRILAPGHARLIPSPFELAVE